jgi:tungstate transport system substrate-binding protein
MTRRLFNALWFASLILALSTTSCFGSCSSDKKGEPVRLATTTSVQDSGLLAQLLPAFEKKTGHSVEIAAVGSGKALAMLAAGEADVAITHAPAAEQQAITAGDAARRTPVMHNAFVIVGPREQLGVVAGAGDFRAVLEKIASSGEKFVSRADGSGTHLREQGLWKAAGIASDAGFIVAAKAGMGDTLRLASSWDAFTMTDRATFISLRDDLDLAIVFQGDDELQNVYSVVEPSTKSSGTNKDGAAAFAAFLRSAEGRALIGGFGVHKHHEPLFTPEP